MIELLWVRDVGNKQLVKPAAIVSAASIKWVRDWRKAHSWASNIPLTLFGGSDLIQGVQFNSDPVDPIPSRVDNAGPIANDLLRVLDRAYREPGIKVGQRAHEIYQIACTAVCEEIAPKGKPVWVIGADADHGELAVCCAQARGGHVAAWARQSIGFIGSTLAADFGVRVNVIDLAPKLR